MYEVDPKTITIDFSGGGSDVWYETVDLVRMVAADNQLESIGKRIAEFNALAFIDVSFFFSLFNISCYAFYFSYFSNYFNHSIITNNYMHYNYYLVSQQQFIFVSRRVRGITKIGITQFIKQSIHRTSKLLNEVIFACRIATFFE